jgi:hypothetical protein
MDKPADSVWPSYLKGQRDHIHAIGVVALNFNRLEIFLHSLLFHYLGTKNEAAHAHVCRSLNLHSLLELFNICLASKEKSHAVRADLAHFAKCYQACADNRNILMHSDLDELDTTEELLTLSKRSGAKPHIFNQLKVSVEELRRVADEIFGTYLYGHQVWMLKSGWTKIDAPLLQRPDVPKSLLAKSPSTDKKPQRQR